jgi:hypothetical protein
MRADAPTHRWTGGASWPWFIFRFYATWPLAVLELSGTTVTLRDRFLWSPLRLLTLSYVKLAPADVRDVFPCRRFASPHLIGIVTNDGEISSSSSDLVLDPQSWTHSLKRGSRSVGRSGRASGCGTGSNRNRNPDEATIEGMHKAAPRRRVLVRRVSALRREVRPSLRPMRASTRA